jgi:sulfate/thiosulfate-binding protein
MIFLPPRNSKGPRRQHERRRIFLFTKAPKPTRRLRNSTTTTCLCSTLARAARSLAQKQLGDVLLNWENELWLAREEFGEDKFDIVYPSRSILGEPPVAVVDEVVDKKGTRDVAEAYLKFLYTSEAQFLAAEHHYRPRDVNVLQKYSVELPKIPLFTVDETFGGWEKAQAEFFAEGALFDQIYRPSKQ